MYIQLKICFDKPNHANTIQTIAQLNACIDNESISASPVYHELFQSPDTSRHPQMCKHILKSTGSISVRTGPVSMQTTFVTRTQHQTSPVFRQPARLQFFQWATFSEKPLKYVRKKRWEQPLIASGSKSIQHGWDLVKHYAVKSFRVQPLQVISVTASLHLRLKSCQDATLTLKMHLLSALSS